ncbi:Uncharacterised protein [uncultured archaeon]|nr:Uncharacterised protein [uncultured archaeon]
MSETPEKNSPMKNLKLAAAFAGLLAISAGSGILSGYFGSGAPKTKTEAPASDSVNAKSDRNYQLPREIDGPRDYRPRNICDPAFDKAPIVEMPSKNEARDTAARGLLGKVDPGAAKYKSFVREYQIRQSMLPLNLQNTSRHSTSSR